MLLNLSSLNKSIKSSLKLHIGLFYSYIFFVVAYACLTLIPAPSELILKRYDISAIGLRLIYVTIIILLIFIWFAGFFAYARMSDYAKLIKKDKDGQQIDKLSKGIFLVVMWLPVSFTLSSALNLLAQKHPGALAATTIVNNYVNLLIPLLGFMFIAQGALGLSNLVRAKTDLRILHLIILFLTYISVVYFHLVVSTSNRNLIYHLSFWPLALTLVGPYIYMWVIGLFSSYQIYRYQHEVSGNIYKRGLTLLSLGFSWLIVTSIGFQYLTTLSAHLSKLSFYWLLVIVYSLLLVLSIGFILIALGARKLQKIEEV